MQPVTFDSDITLRSRFECKYMISAQVVADVRSFIAPFVRPDEFAAMREHYRYPISSLYLDTDDLSLYQQTVGGNKNRFKLRVRTYSDRQDSPAFLEVKRRINNIVAKRRARLDRRLALRLLEQGAGNWVLGLPSDVRRDAEFFAKHASLIGAKPLVRVRYLREAYESKGGDPVRITLDTDLSHAVTFGFDLSHSAGQWVATPLRGVILEIKFTERFPPWVQDLVRIFDLKQQPVPKYVMSVEHALEHGRAAALSVAGFTMPPRRV